MDYVGRGDMLIAPCARRNRFATSARIRDELNIEDHVSLRTDNRRLKNGNVMGTAAFGGCGVTVLGVFLLIVS
jgi:hypothetical protein